MQARVLVVDDDALFQREITRHMQAAGYVCDCAPTGLDALRLGLRNRYDLIVTDIEMPTLDGLKIILRLRLSSANKHTPVVIVSGSGQAARVLQAKGLGVSAFLLKPVFPEDLLEHAARLTGGSSDCLADSVAPAA